MNTQNEKNEKDTNPDLITGEHGSHPIATGVGSAGAGLAGAAIGTAVAGPIGTIVGGAIGAIAGGYGGKAVGEAVDPTVESAYWQEHHAEQPFSTDGDYETFSPAYRTGYEGYVKNGQGRSFEDAESDLRSDYERSNPGVAWDKAKDATRAAWNRVSDPNRR